MSAFKGISAALRRGVLQVASAATPEAASQAFAELKITAERALVAVSGTSHADKLAVAVLAIEARLALQIGQEILSTKGEEDEERQEHRRKFSFGKMNSKKRTGAIAAITPKL